MANQLSGFYMRATLALNELISVSKNNTLIENMLDRFEKYFHKILFPEIAGNWITQMTMPENSIVFVNVLLQLVLLNGFTIAVLASLVLQKVNGSAVNA